MGYDFILDEREARVVPMGRPLGGDRFVDLEIEGARLRARLEPGSREGEYFLSLDGRRERIFVASRGDVQFVHWRGRTHRVEAPDALERVRASTSRASGAEELRAPMPGVVVAVAVAAGDRVETGTLLMTIESMKLQTAITASHPGRVTAICVAVGDSFELGSPLVRLGFDEAATTGPEKGDAR